VFLLRSSVLFLGGYFGVFAAAGFFCIKI